MIRTLLILLAFVAGCVLPPVDSVVPDGSGAGGSPADSVDASTASTAGGATSTGAWASSTAAGSGSGVLPPVADCTGQVVSCAFDAVGDGSWPLCVWWDSGVMSTQDPQACCISAWAHYDPVIGTACPSAGLVGCCTCLHGAAVFGNPPGHVSTCTYEGDALEQQQTCEAGVWGTGCVWGTTPP